MSDSESKSFVSDAEIQAALAEAEVEQHIPTLDDGSGVVTVPVTPDRVPEVKAPEEPHEPRPAEPASPEPTESDVDAESDAADELPTSWVVRLGQTVYRVVDRVLWAINLPFERVPVEHRNLVAMIAVVTLAMSWAAVTLLPAVLPHRTPVTILEDWSEAAEAEAAPANPEAAESSD